MINMTRSKPRRNGADALPLFAWADSRPSTTPPTSWRLRLVASRHDVPLAVARVVYTELGLDIVDLQEAAA